MKWCFRPRFCPVHNAILFPASNSLFNQHYHNWSTTAKQAFNQYSDPSKYQHARIKWQNVHTTVNYRAKNMLSYTTPFSLYDEFACYFLLFSYYFLLFSHYFLLFSYYFLLFSFMSYFFLIISYYFLIISYYFLITSYCFLIISYYFLIISYYFLITSYYFLITSYYFLLFLIIFLLFLTKCIRLHQTHVTNEEDKRDM